VFFRLFNAPKKSGPLDPVTGEFRHPDPAAIAKHLQLEKLGQRRGKAELPASDVTALDDMEQSVYREISRIAQLGREQVSRQFEVLTTAQSSVALAGIAAQIETEADRFAIRMVARVRAGTIALFNKKRAVADSERGLKEFKEQHRITRPADYPDASGHRRLMAVLALVFAVESVFNAFLFAEASEFGLVGGFFEAMFISLINIALGFVVGLLILPHITHSRSLHSAGFLLIAILCGISLLAWNLLAGHYRDAVAAFAVSGDPLSIPRLGGAALDALASQPLRLEEFKSWMFVILGAIAIIVALTDGYRWDEPYPGYGRRARQNRELVRAYGELFSRLQDDLHRTAESGQRRIGELVEKYRAQLTKAYELHSRARSLEERFRGYLMLLEHVGNELLAKYRYANRGARSTPPPAHFEEPFTLSAEDKAVPTFAQREIREADLEGLTSRAYRKITNHHGSLLQAYRTVEQLEADQVGEVSAVAVVEDALGELKEDPNGAEGIPSSAV